VFYIEQYRTLNGLELTDQQFKAVENLRDYDFSLIIGVSGGGKTSSTQSLINVCDDIGLSYTLLAPTGTASMRLAESTHREATTIHLKCLRDVAINTDVLIVDECSMIGLDVFNMMISAITNPNIKVVLVGDNFQLVSISQGTIFSDIIESEVVPKAMLTKVFRYGESGILYSATNERQGRYFLDDDCVKHENGIYSIKSNYFFIPRSEDEEILEETLNGYFKLIKKGIKPKDILLLTGYNVGDCGALNLNNIIQKELNPPKPNEIVWTKKYRDVKIDFRVGDRIMNIKNNYKALNPESYEMIVQSGGLISKDDLSQDMFSTVYNGQRGVIIELTKDKMVCKFDNDTIVYQKNDLNDYLLLSYAMTIHKSQGSESPYVITIYSPNQKRVMNRNLLYVGDTRAKKKQIDIGDLKTFRDALLVDGVEQRNTWLKELIIKN
jgi:ATP-dependent exoDNAse (exonuclease V) alpha subunit